MPSTITQFGELQVAMVSHDLRGPLHAIVLGLEILRNRPLGPPEDLVVQRMYKAARRMTVLVERILVDSAVPPGGAITLQRGLVRLDELCNDMLEELRIGHPAREITLAAEDGICGVWDRVWLVELLSNLVENALEHGDPCSSVSVRIRSAEDRAVIEVSNHGPDIPPELLSEIFEPFRRASISRNGGVGLGLFMVAQIAAAHGGSVEVSSACGTTVFRVTLPLRLP